MLPHPLAIVLRPVAARAGNLPWAKQRQWTPKTHLGWDHGLPLVDLHDLSVALALEVVGILLDAPPSEGGFVLITGRGNHTGGRSKLKDAVEQQLSARATEGVLRFSPRGPGRFEVVLDPVAVRGARPGMGLLFWLFVVLLLMGLVVTVLNRL